MKFQQVSMEEKIDENGTLKMKMIQSRLFSENKN